jgi:hypothetical protein
MFRFVEHIETALSTEKRGRGENPAHLVAVIEALDIDDFADESEMAGCIAALEAFCRPAGHGASQPATPSA